MYSFFYSATTSTFLKTKMQPHVPHIFFIINLCLKRKEDEQSKVWFYYFKKNENNFQGCDTKKTLFSIFSLKLKNNHFVWSLTNTTQTYNLII